MPATIQFAMRANGAREGSSLDDVDRRLRFAAQAKLNPAQVFNDDYDKRALALEFASEIRASVGRPRLIRIAEVNSKLLLGNCLSVVTDSKGTLHDTR